MSRTVTSEVLIAYSLCPQKAFLLLCTEEKGTLHKYEQILQQQQHATQNHSHTALLQTNLDIRSYAPAALTSACDVLVNATLLTEGLEAVCSMLTKVVQPSSLGGYSYEPAIIRLAKAYCISPKILVIQEILPLLDLSQRSAYRIHARWSEGGQNLNGLNSSTVEWTKALKQLTLRDDLHLLTMMTWSSVLSQSGMFRRIKAWCSACYNEWYASQEVYEPLLWAFRAVTVCPRHCQPLSLQCPYVKCRKPIPVISTKSLPGYCPYCGGWLGICTSEQTPEELQEYDEQIYWSANAIGELIAAAPSFTEAPQKETFLSAMRSLLESVNMNLLASQAHVCRELEFGWLSRVPKPQISTLLSICFVLRTSPLNLLKDNSAFPASIDNPVIDTEYFQRLNVRHRKVPSNMHDVRKALEAVLLSEEKPTLNKVAKDLGYSNTCTIYKCDAELCRAITAKRQTDTKSLQMMLEAIMVSDENPPPSMEEAARRLGYSVPFLWRRYREICRAISERYKKYQHTNRVSRQQPADACRSGSPVLS